MLDKKSKRVLKSITKLSNSSDYITMDELLDTLPKKFTLKLTEQVLTYLQSLDLVECCWADNGIVDITINYSGKNYREFEWLKFKSFLYKSILTPIVVSFITAVLTFFLLPK